MTGSVVIKHELALDVDGRFLKDTHIVYRQHWTHTIDSVAKCRLTFYSASPNPQSSRRSLPPSQLLLELSPHRPLLINHLQLILLHPLNLHQLRLKHQRTPRRNRSHSPLPIPIFRRNRQHPLIPNTHIQQPLIPPLNHLSLPYRKCQWLPTVVGGVELRAVGFESAAVVDGDDVAGLAAARALLAEEVLGSYF